MLPKFSNKNLILVDVDALRRAKPRKAIDLKRVPTASQSAEDANDGDDSVDPLAAVIALARRKTRR
jgi:hypothetical protein